MKESGKSKMNIQKIIDKVKETCEIYSIIFFVVGIYIFCGGAAIWFLYKFIELYQQNILIMGACILAFLITNPIWVIIIIGIIFLRKYFKILEPQKVYQKDDYDY
jgi:uncharacterized membrane protein